jgi:hypothetical protein
MVEDVCRACLSSTQTKDVWYIDSGASSHMTGHKHYFSNFEERGFDFEILLGDDYTYHPKEVGTVKFERESGKPLYLSDVLYVPRLKKNLVSVSALEDKGYEVSFKE